MLFTAVKPESELRTSPPRLLPVRWRFENFLEVLADPGFQTWLQVSLIVAVASTALVVLAAVPAAYYTARHRFRGRSAFLFLVLVTQMFSPTALVVGLYREFFELDLVNTYAALVVTNAAFNLAFAIWILRAFFASIPQEIEEAAAVDGCGRLGALVRVVLPLSRPGIVTATIFAFIAAWNEYIVIFVRNAERSHRWYTDVLGIHTQDIAGHLLFPGDAENASRLPRVRSRTRSRHRPLRGGGGCPRTGEGAGGPEPHGLADGEPRGPEADVPEAPGQGCAPPRLGPFHLHRGLLRGS